MTKTTCRWLCRLTSVFVVAFMVVGTAAAHPAQRPTSAVSSEVARAWFDLHLRLVRRTWGFSPPVTSRAFGYLGVSLYEAVVPGMATHQSLATQLNGLAGLPRPQAGASYHWGATANGALATMTRHLFPTAHAEHKAAIEALYGRYAERFGQDTDAATIERSTRYGEQIANAIYEWSKTDGGHDSYKFNFPHDYQPPTGEGLWQPTQRAKSQPQPAMQPTWGENRPFVLSAGGDCAPPPPPPFSTAPESPFYKEAAEVYATSHQLTAEQIEIARFWADDPFRTATPAGHSISILTQVLSHEGATLAVAAEAYAKMGIALADAFISCWHTKYQYHVLRPVTYIQAIIDDEWQPFLTTPPFPEYTSGHSVESSAAAEVLTGLFGDNYAFTDHTHTESGMSPRTFASFRAFAQEAALSRLYGGLHFRSAIENGLKQGACVYRRLERLQFRQ